MAILRQILAVFVGLVVGGIAVGTIEGISSLMHPMPEGMDMNDPDQIAEFVSSLPTSAFMIVLMAWMAGAFIGGYVARAVARHKSMLPSLVVIGILLAAVVINLVMIPHPVWLWFTGIAATIFTGILGMVFAAPKEYVVSTVRHIKAPVEKVFKTLATIEEFKKAVPGIVDVEFLTESRYGVGTRFKETRMMNGKEASTELEVTELVENESIRLVSDAGGTIWDTVFRVSGDDTQTKMEMKMDARPHAFPAKVITPMILKMVAKFVEQDMDSVKEFCEQESAAT